MLLLRSSLGSKVQVQLALRLAMTTFEAAGAVVLDFFEAKLGSVLEYRT